jgi:hypothetical protein
MRSIFIVICFIFFIIPNISAQPVSLSVTNKNIGLVEETRTLSLPAGINQIQLVDLPTLLDPTSVRVEFSDQSIRLHEQHFAYDLLDAQKILEKSVGKTVRILHPDLGTTIGTLLSIESGMLVVETVDKEWRIIPNYANGHLVIEDPPVDDNDFVTRPTLIWLLETESQSQVKARMSYLTSGVNWQAEYTAILNNKETKMSLAAWVVLTNNSGKAFQEADLTLIAGDLNMSSGSVPPPMPRRTAAYEMSKQMDAPFEEREVFEYHSYHLDRKISIDNHQNKQLPLFPELNSGISKTFGYNYQKDPNDISVLISAENTKKNGLGIPLPMGRIRVYKKEKEKLFILGENSISHIPRDEKISIEIGKAFDIKAERSLLERKRETKNTERLQIAIEFRNRKSEDIEILVTEPVSRSRDYRILANNINVHKKDAGKVEFIVPVKAKQSNTLNFEILYTW